VKSGIFLGGYMQSGQDTKDRLRVTGFHRG
jgi:hypothetical protein